MKVEDNLRRVENEEKTYSSLINSMKQQIGHMKGEIEILKADNVKNVMELKSTHDLHIQNLLDEHWQEVESLKRSYVDNQDTNQGTELLTSRPARDQEIIDLNENLTI